ncbi:acyl-CoA N-acyltransferase [Backusella circina FSU 941]|nr:acyl-CoA N-acyltransferase [Backusella circina FSU 941]
MEPEVQIQPHPLSAKIPDFAEWSTNITENTEICLVQPQQGDGTPGEVFHNHTFNPEFTYPIFGDHETVFGYKDLALTISFASGSLRAFVQVNHTEQYEDTLDIKKDDILNTLNEFLPKDNPKTKAEFVDTVYKDFETFKPIGEKIKEYEKGDSLFEIYKCDFTNDKFKEYYQRMQVFALFFIEGSSYIDVDDEKWEIYTVFQFKKETDSYDFIGYCNAYPFYCWPENIRMRIR